VSRRRVVSFTGPRSVAVRERPTETVGDDQLRVETTLSGVSAGTELLVYRDEVPEEMPVDATLPAFEGASFDYPLAYGYAAVGRVVETGTETDDDWLGRRVFAHGDVRRRPVGGRPAPRRALDDRGRDVADRRDSGDARARHRTTAG